MGRMTSPRTLYVSFLEERATCENKGHTGQDLMKDARDGIWIIDSEASTLYANAVMAEILGEDLAQLIGKPSFEYVFPEDMEGARQLFESKQRGDIAPFRFRLRRKDGSAINVLVQGTPMHNVAGEFMGIVGTFRVTGEQAVDAAA